MCGLRRMGCEKTAESAGDKRRKMDSSEKTTERPASSAIGEGNEKMQEYANNA